MTHFIRTRKRKIFPEVKKQFFTYVSTTMLTSVLTSIYASIDGIFIGQAVGDNGLTAVSVIWPVEGIATSIARGVGMGGAICMSLALGAGKEKEGYRFRGNTVLLLLLDYLFMALVFRQFYPEALRAFGATDPEIFRLSEAYTRVYLVGCFWQIMACGLQPFLRNSNQPVHAMIYQIIGVVINIVLDYYLVLVVHWEVMGAGLATIIAETFACIPTLYSFFTNREYPQKLRQYIPRLNTMLEIIKSGISPMGSSISNSILVILNNLFCLHFGGVVAGAAYSVINYSYCCGYMFVMGISEGIQPMISYYYGQKNYQKVEDFLYLGKKYVWILGGAATIIFILARHPLAVLFGASDEAMSMVMWGMLISAWLFPFKGMVRLQSMYFNAVGSNLFSNILIYAEVLVLTPLFLWIFTGIAGVDGVWISMPVIQLVLMIVGHIFYDKRVKNI